MRDGISLAKVLLLIRLVELFETFIMRVLLQTAFIS